MQNFESVIERAKKAVVIIASVIYLIFNISFLVQGFTLRYRADDYCFTGFLYQQGFIGGLIEFYTTTSNRFSAYLISALTDSFGQSGIRLISPFVILLFMLSLFFTLSVLFNSGRNRDNHLRTIALSQVIIFFSVYLAPNRHQSVFWRSGLIHYFLPVPLIILIALAILKLNLEKLHAPRNIMWIYLGSFLNAGLSESAAAMQTSAIILIFGYICLFNPREECRKRSKFWISAFLGSLSAMGVMIASPGNALRLNTLTQAPDVWSIAKITFASATSFIKLSLRGAWLPFTVLFFFSTALAILTENNPDQSKKRSFSQKLYIVFSLLLLIFAVCAPTAYGMMAFPENRVLMLAQIALIGAVSSAGSLVGWLISLPNIMNKSFKIGAVAGMIILAFYPLRAYQYRLSELGFYRMRAADWDENNVQIVSQINQGNTEIVIPALDSFAEIAEMRPDKDFWVNVCAARFYQIDSIIALEN